MDPEECCECERTLRSAIVPGLRRWPPGWGALGHSHGSGLHDGQPPLAVDRDVPMLRGRGPGLQGGYATLQPPTSHPKACATPTALGRRKARAAVCTVPHRLAAAVGGSGVHTGLGVGRSAVGPAVGAGDDGRGCNWACAGGTASRKSLIAAQTKTLLRGRHGFVRAADGAHRWGPEGR